MSRAPESYTAWHGRCCVCMGIEMCANRVCRQCAANVVAEWARVDRATLLREAAQGKPPESPLKT